MNQPFERVSRQTTRALVIDFPFFGANGGWATNFNHLFDFNVGYSDGSAKTVRDLSMGWANGNGQSPFGSSLGYANVAVHQYFAWNGYISQTYRTENFWDKQ